jgi:hypothetical protein
VFTARYALSPYIKQIRFVFKGLEDLPPVTDTSHEDLCTLMIISRSFLLRMRTVLDKSCRENQKTRFMFNNFFFPQNRVVYEIMWKNTAQPDRSQMTI